MNYPVLKDSKTSILLPFFLVSVFSQALAYQLHEFAHFLVGFALGLKQQYVMTGVIIQQEMSDFQTLLHSLGGPVITLTLALISLAVFLRYKDNASLTSQFALTFVYSNTFLRVQPMITDLISGNIKFQDEYKIAAGLGISETLLCITSLLIFSSILASAFLKSGNNKLLKLTLFIIASITAALSINSIAAHLFFI